MVKHCGHARYKLLPRPRCRSISPLIYTPPRLISWLRSPATPLGALNTSHPVKQARCSHLTRYAVGVHCWRQRIPEKGGSEHAHGLIIDFVIRVRIRPDHQLCHIFPCDAIRVAIQ